MRVVTDVVRVDAPSKRTNTGADDWILIDSNDFAVRENLCRSTAGPERLNAYIGANRQWRFHEGPGSDVSIRFLARRIPISKFNHIYVVMSIKIAAPTMKSFC